MTILERLQEVKRRSEEESQVNLEVKNVKILVEEQELAVTGIAAEGKNQQIGKYPINGTDIKDVKIYHDCYVTNKGKHSLTSTQHRNKKHKYLFNSKRR